MAIQQALIWVFLFSLQGGSCNFLEDQTISYVPYIRTEGEDVTVDCPASSAYSPKFFCREECTERDILINPTNRSTWTGKYTYMWTSVTPETPDKGVLKIVIHQLTKSDSGLYRCGVGGSTSSASYTYIQLIIVDVTLNSQRRHAAVSLKPEENLVVYCYVESQQPARSFFLCTPEQCLDIPIITTHFTVLIGRFAFTYVDTTRAKRLHLSISHLQESDSRTYRCGLKLLSQVEQRSFHLSVSGDPLAVKPKLETSTSDPTSVESAESPEPGSPSPTPKPTNITQLSAQAPSDGLVYVIVVLVVIIIVLGLALILVFTLKNIRPLGLNSRGQMDDMNMEVPSYENHLPTSGIEESVYESLDPANTEQSYSTISYRSQNAAKTCP